ncbi:MAG TPA: 4-coumarate--CoA ligase family protein [Pyrinomonadaceae bacterium]|jgi:acyl-CoA synthetase (AMP-forming)/AMP-acid ligase II
MIFRGPYTDVEIPEVALTPLVLRQAERLPDKPALIEGLSGRVLTYGELARHIRRAAASLSQRGLVKGDVFAIYSFNYPEFAVAFHAVALLGGINTPVNTLYTAEEVARQLKDSGAKFLLTVPQLLDKALEAARASGVQEVFVIGEAEGATGFNALLEGLGEPPLVQINPREDMVALPYSSGTTGLPKGVMLTHRNLVANIRQMEGLCYFSEDDTLVCVLPLFHIYGLVVILNMGLYMGATIVTLPRFELEQFLQTLETYSVTLAHLVPPVLLALAKQPVVDRYDLSQLKTIFCGAAPLGEDLSRACMERLGCHLRQGYGMTETSPVTHSTPADPAQFKHGSVGTLAPNTECKIVDPSSGAALGTHQEGEICVRGPQIMKGYLNRPDATAETIDEEGWLHTGDIGYADEEGHFFIVDRVKELIKYKGFQVAPAELEALLLSHPSVADAAVIPYADEEAGEVPKAFVVLKPGLEKTDATAEELMAYVAARVASHKKIRLLEFIEQIPKSLSGKILRRVLKERERAKKKKE